MEEIKKEDLEKIEKYTVSKVEPEKLFTFSVLLCDNEIDRDNQCFSTDALYQMKDLFLGKTGIFDHDRRASGQTARIYETEVIEDSGKLTSYGETYCMLKAKAYMVRHEKNKDLVLEIEAGIKKEVSVGCSVSSVKCSVCGKNKKKDGDCGHKLGTKKDGELIYEILSDITDAYEWSFVVVPAQKKAGTFKKYAEDNNIKNLSELKGMISKSAGMNKVLEELERLETYAEFGRGYRDELICKTSALLSKKINVLEPKVAKDMLMTLPFDEVKKMYSGLSKKRPAPQLSYGEISSTENNEEFKI